MEVNKGGAIMLMSVATAVGLGMAVALVAGSASYPLETTFQEFSRTLLKHNEVGVVCAHSVIYRYPC